MLKRRKGKRKKKKYGPIIILCRGVKSNLTLSSSVFDKFPPSQTTATLNKPQNYLSYYLPRH